MIHEAVHKYQRDDLLIAMDQSINEGLTEYFARKVCGRVSIPRTQYARQTALAQHLVSRIGEQAVGEAFFHGDVQRLKDAFLAYRRRLHGSSEQSLRDWDQFLADCGTSEPGEHWDRGVALVVFSVQDRVSLWRQHEEQGKRDKSGQEQRKVKLTKTPSKWNGGQSH